MIKNIKLLKITFHNNAPLLEIISTSSNIEDVFFILDKINVVSYNHYIVQTNEHFILHAKLHEYDGSLISKNKVFEVLNILSRELCK